MTRERLSIYSKEEVEGWCRPPLATIAEDLQPRYLRGCSALSSVALGEVGITAAARDNGLCRKRLRSMIDRAPRLAPDGLPYGFRVCAPWGSYCHTEAANDPVVPKTAKAHSMAMLLRALPKIAEWVDAYSQPLPPGKPPVSFDRLHKKIVTELKRQELHDYYPLNQDDHGRRALLRYIRNRRIETGPGPIIIDTFSEPQSTLAEIFRGHPYDRIELDGHRIDVETTLQIKGPRGKSVTRKITALWFVAVVECESRAILGWILRVGRNYNNLDVTSALAQCMSPWVPRDLVIPGLAYTSGAGMPSGLAGPLAFRRARMVAMDNHKAHHSINVEESFCRAHDGILTQGRPHQPKTRPVIEQLYSRLEKGAIREIPGGFEPAKRLGDDKILISNFSPESYPVQMHLLEELFSVIVANYNATPHPSLGDMSPLQYLQQRSNERLWFYEPGDAETCAIDMNSALVQVTVVGDKKNGVLPHVNYAYVRYRSPELDNQWELVGKKLTARVFRHDLRSLVLLRSATKPVGVLRALAPWSHTRHDETTRKLIFQWSRQKGGLKIAGVDCAIKAYVTFLRSHAKESQQAVDQLARIQQQFPQLPRPSSNHPLMETPLRTSRRQWLSLDDVRDA